MLLYDPLIPIMALAFADDAFANEFNGPEDVYDLVVPVNSDRLRLRWKEEWCNRPVFRDVEPSANGVRVARDKPLPYSKERGHLIRLGRSIGLAYYNQGDSESEGRATATCSGGEGDYGKAGSLSGGVGVCVCGL